MEKEIKSRLKANLVRRRENSTVVWFHSTLDVVMMALVLTLKMVIISGHYPAPGSGRRGKDGDGGDHWGSQLKHTTGSTRQHMVAGLTLEEDHGIKAGQQDGTDLGVGEEEPLPLPLLPLIILERGGKGERGVRRQACIHKIQAFFTLTRIQIDRSDRLLSVLPGVDGHLGGRLEGGGGPVNCAGQGPILDHLVVVESFNQAKNQLMMGRHGLQEFQDPPTCWTSTPVGGPILTRDSSNSG